LAGFVVLAGNRGKRKSLRVTQFVSSKRDDVPKEALPLVSNVSGFHFLLSNENVVKLFDIVVALYKGR
jgi:hypothetical protein